MCVNRMRDMASNLSNGGAPDFPNITPFLVTIQSKFMLSDYNNKWFAAAGRACQNPTRTSLVSFPLVTNGCRTSNPYSDSLVGDDSARLQYPNSTLTPSGDCIDFDRRYQHAPNMGNLILNVLCSTIPGAASIHNPTLGDSLYRDLLEFLNGL